MNRSKYCFATAILIFTGLLVVAAFTSYKPPPVDNRTPLEKAWDDAGGFNIYFTVNFDFEYEWVETEFNINNNEIFVEAVEANLNEGSGMMYSSYKYVKRINLTIQYTILFKNSTGTYYVDFTEDIQLTFDTFDKVSIGNYCYLIQLHMATGDNYKITVGS